MPLEDPTEPVLPGVVGASSQMPPEGPTEPVVPGVVGASFDEPKRLDPDRAKGGEPDDRQKAPRRRAFPIGVVGSIAIHILPLLLLLSWSSSPVEITPPIPVQLVLEVPPPPAPPPPVPAFKPPPPGRLASEDLGEVADKPEKASPPPEPSSEEPPETKLAAVAPPPKPEPPTEAEPLSTSPEPKPKPPNKPVKPAVAHPPNPNPSGHVAIPGPDATKDAYLAYCMSLIRRHFDLLSPAFLAGRRGATILNLTVLDDGTIARISIAHPSPYPDIDARLEQVVALVQRFPPLPQWFQGPQLGLILHVGFPEGL